MRVLHVIPAIAARYGGPSTAVIGMCRALSTAGIETVIATTDADGSDRLPVATDSVRPHEDIPTIFFRRQVSESFKWSTPLATWLQAHVREFDLVHVHAVFSHSSLAAGRACREAGVPYIVRPLGSLDPWSLDRHPRRKRLLLALGGRRFLRGARALHYTTLEEQQLSERRLRWLPEGSVVPLGVEDEFFESTERILQRPRPVLLSMGRLHPKKGLDLLIEAFHAVASGGAFDSWRLVIAGDGDKEYVDHLQCLGATGSAEQPIEFRGWLRGTARRDLLRSSSLFALPSYQENFGIALVEAMASGLPALITRGVNLAAEVRAAGAGWVCEPTVQSLSATLRTAMSKDRDLRQRGRRARALAERFRWASVVQQLQMFYERALHDPSPSLEPELHPARHS